MMFVGLLPEGEEEILAEPFQHLVGKDGKLLVGTAFHEEGIPRLPDGFADAQSLPDGIPRDVEVEVVGEERFELQSQQATLGQHTAVLLQAVAEVGLPAGVGDDQCFAKQGSYLGACLLYTSDAADDTLQV